MYLVKYSQKQKPSDKPGIVDLRFDRWEKFYFTLSEAKEEAKLWFEKNKPYCLAMRYNIYKLEDIDEEVWNG